MADHHDLAPLEAREPADDRLVVREGAIPGELDEVLEQELDVVEGVGTRRVARQLHLLPRRQLGEDLLLELARLPLEPLDLVGEVDRPARQLAQLVDLPLQLDDGPLELEHLSVVGRLRGHRRCYPDLPARSQAASSCTSTSSAVLYHVTAGSERNQPSCRRAYLRVAAWMRSTSSASGSPPRRHARTSR